MISIIYDNDKVKSRCTSLNAATRFFGGNKDLARHLLSRIFAINNAECLKDIRLIPSFRFHNLHGNLEGLFAIDVKSRKDKWRIILQPLDENEEIFDPCHIDEISAYVTVVKIIEVSAHYE